MTATPKFQKGQAVRVPSATPGHDRHDPNRVFRVTHVYQTGGVVSYKLEGSPSIWPETRLKDSA